MMRGVVALGEALLQYRERVIVPVNYEGGLLETSDLKLNITLC